MNREAIMQALFALLSGAAAWSTAGRRRLPWTEVAAQPAIFLVGLSEHWDSRPTRMPAKVTIDCEAWIYSRAGQSASVVPGVVLNQLVEATIAAIQPAPGFDAQTLGGLVTHCWVEGEVLLWVGDLGPQAVARIPLKILTTTLGR